MYVANTRSSQYIHAIGSTRPGIWSGAASSPTSTRAASRASPTASRSTASGGFITLAGRHLGHRTGGQAHRRHPEAGAGRQLRVRWAGPADAVLLRALLRLHAARQGFRHSHPWYKRRGSSFRRDRQRFVERRARPCRRRSWRRTSHVPIGRRSRIFADYVDVIELECRIAHGFAFHPDRPGGYSSFSGGDYQRPIAGSEHPEIRLTRIKQLPIGSAGCFGSGPATLQIT
jgi:hypothetical protein